MDTSAPIYEQMWQRFCAAMREGHYQLDPWIDSPEDSRRGITTLAYLEQNSPQLCQQIGHFIEACRELEPEQYFHPLSELHLTLLPVISCVAGFRLEQVNAADYVAIFEQCLRESEPFEIEFNGVTASPACIVIQGFATSDALLQLRERLRARFNSSGLLTSFDSRYKLVTAHSSVVRFRAPLRNPRQLLAVCQRYKNHYFGKVRLTLFDLVVNNWYQNASVTRSLAHFALGE